MNHLSLLSSFSPWDSWRTLWALLYKNQESQNAAAFKSLQLCLTLCNPIDSSPPGSAAPGILQAETLEWVAISFSNAWKWKVKVKSLSRVWLLATPWTAAYQAPPSMGFSRQEYWSGLPFSSPSVNPMGHHFSSNKNNKILKNNSKQGGKRSVYYKL